MTRIRRPLLFALGALTVILLLGLTRALAKAPRVDRVGGKANACACTQRIEP